MAFVWEMNIDCQAKEAGYNKQVLARRRACLLDWHLLDADQYFWATVCLLEFLQYKAPARSDSHLLLQCTDYSQLTASLLIRILTESGFGSVV